MHAKHCVREKRWFRPKGTTLLNFSTLIPQGRQPPQLPAGLSATQRCFPPQGALPRKATRLGAFLEAPDILASNLRGILFRSCLQDVELVLRGTCSQLRPPHLYCLDLVLKVGDHGVLILLPVCVHSCIWNEFCMFRHAPQRPAGEVLKWQP